MWLSSNSLLHGVDVTSAQLMWLKPFASTYLPTYLHTNIPTYQHTNIPTYLPTYIPTYLPTYIHTYIRAHMYMSTMCIHSNLHAWNCDIFCWQKYHHDHSWPFWLKFQQHLESIQHPSAGLVRSHDKKVALAKQNGDEVSHVSRATSLNGTPNAPCFYDVLKIDRAAEGEGRWGFRLVT